MTESARTDAAPAEVPIEWFHRNLELLVEDIELGDQTEIFFDTTDFIAIVLGMYFFYKKKRKSSPRSFDWPSFYGDDCVLVHCLATAGWLGKVRMLPPHQAEFLGLLRRDFDLADVNESPKDIARRFLAEGQQGGQLAADEDNSINLEQLERLTGPDLIAALGGKAELAKEIFQLLQCIRGSWRTRFLAYQEQGLFADLGRFDPITYLEDDIFRQVRHALDESRGKKRSINNFSDALAVTILARRTREFDQQVEGAKLPLFFLHGGQLRDAILSSGLESELQYCRRRDGELRTFSVLRDWRYFYFRATFDQESISNDELRELLTQTARLRQDRGSEKRDEVLIALDSAAEIKVSEQIERMREFRFFHTWLTSKKEIQQVFADLERANLDHARLREAFTELQSDEFKEKFEEGQEVLSQNYETSVGMYPRAYQLLRLIDARIRKIYRAKKGGALPSEMMMVLGLLRFPFPADVYSWIEKTLGNLVTQGDARGEAQAAVVKTLFQTNSEVRLDLPGLAFTFGMLWAAELDDEIVDLARKWALTESPWFLVVWASALVRESEEKRHTGLQASETTLRRQADLILQGFQLLRKIKEVQHSTSEEIAIASLAVGIAYLDFHFFLALSSIRLRPYLSPELLREDLPSLLSNAVDQADRARRTVKLDERLRVYALNQLVYYIADSVLQEVWKFADRAEQLHQAARELKAYQGCPHWHYRYNDTLARYHEVVGQANDDRKEWEMGRSYIELARENCFDDPLIKGTLDTPGYYKDFIRHYNVWMHEHPEAAASAKDAPSNPV
ncbi:MAG TPA: hypothetical protein VGH73_05860 [Thermoanaerobaculia bacterium]|jgi:hypothetical protein